MKKLIIFFILSLTVNFKTFSQCTVTGFKSSDSIVCGSCAILSAYGRGQGLIIFQENFNSGTPAGWQYTQQAMFNNPCSPNGVDGTTHIWMGNSSPVPRALVTQSYNLSSGIAGVTICFDMMFATQGDAAPCEGPDEPDEGVYLQYSTDNGANWITVHYFDPNGGNDPDFINWHNWCFQLPTAAITSNTQIRWFQDNDSGADYDHWGIDNVQIYFNDPTYNIVMLHDNYSLGATGGIDPTPVCPRTSTDYVIRMSNGTSTCYDTVRVNVKMPAILVDAHADTTICSGRCALLNSTGKVIVSPAKTARYSNDELTSIVSGFNQVTTININITTLNMTNILPGSILSVCIHDLRYFGQVFFPTPQTVGIGALKITLECPSGNVITLVPSGVTTNPSLLSGYHNTCFVPVGGADISLASAPYTGSFDPSQPMSNLYGCTGNGLWKMNITMTTALGFGTGTFTGWEIIFDDPEISYEGNFSWNPTTNLTNYNTLSPTACPPNSTNYYLTVSDTAGCVSATDSVNIRVSNCCAFSVNSNITMTSCNQSNGAIDLAVTPPGSNYTFQWGNGAQTQNISGIPAGIYSVTVTDVNTNCSLDTTYTVEENNSFTRETGFSPAHCGYNDGSAYVVCSGGSGNFTYLWNTTPEITESTITNVTAGNYEVTVSDGVCTYVLTVTIPDVPGPTADFSASPMTGVTPLTVNFTYTGTGANSYNWSFGDGNTSTQQNPSHTYIITGSYDVILIVSSGSPDFCSDTFKITIVTQLPSFIVVPNAFTPNNDGYNDQFILTSQSITTFKGQIFNRWGKKIFEWENVAKGWDGKTPTGNSAEGVYYYIIKAKGVDAVDFNLSGSITLLR